MTNPREHSAMRRPIRRRHLNAIAARQVGPVMLPTDESLHPDHPVAEAIARMRAARLPMLPVVDGDEIVGIFTLKDAAHRKEQPAAPLAAEDARAPRVADHMSAEIPYCYASDDLATAKEILRRTGQSWLLVVNGDDEYIGLVSADAASAAARPQGAPLPRAAARRTTATGRARSGGAGAPMVYSMRPKLRR